MRSIYDNAVVTGYAVQLNTTGATVTTGASVDTRGYNTGALRVFVSNVGTGLPVNTGASLTVVLQKSTDGTTWATATDNTGATIGMTVTATTTVVVSSARIEGLNLNQSRYLRVQTTAAFGGAASISRQFTSCAVLELARAYNRPVTTTESNT